MIRSVDFTERIGGPQPKLERMMQEIRKETPEHQLQYVPEPWILRFPELLDRAIVVLRDYMAVAIDCPGYTSWMTNPDLASVATTFFDEYTSKLIEFASQFGLTSLNSAGDEILFTGLKQHALRNVAFGFGAQAIFMEALQNYQELKTTVETHKGRSPALIHAGFVHPRDALENLTLGLIDLGNDEQKYAAFYNGGDAIVAKHIASTGFIGTTTGNLRLGGSEREGWGPGKYGPPIVFRERLDETTIRRLQEEVGVAVSTDISAEPATLNMPYTAIEILNLTLNPDQVLELKERVDNIAPPAIIARDADPSYPPDFPKRVRSLAHGMSPLFQRGQIARAQPATLREIVDQHADSAVFTSINWDKFHLRVRRSKELLFDHPERMSDDEQKIALAKMVGAGIRHMAETVSRQAIKSGIVPKEMEATVHHDAYLIFLDNITGENSVYPGSFGTEKIATVLEGIKALKTRLFRDGFVEVVAAEVEHNGDDIRVNREVLHSIVENTNFHMHVGIASGKGAIVNEPTKRANHGGLQMLGVRGAVIPVASRLMGTLAKQAYRGQLRELQKIVTVDPDAMSQDERSQLAVLQTLKLREQDDAIIMETEQAAQLFDLHSTPHESLPNFPLKGVKKPVNMTIVFPSGARHR